jgi:hypothetical protein
LKKETVDDLISDLKDQLDVGFLSPDHKGLAKVCKKLLIFMGYKVVNPVKRVFKVKNINDLITLFYAYLDYKHPELAGTHRNIKKDRAIAKRFLEARMEIGSLNKEYALDECAQIIKIIFDREPDFNFTIPLSFEIFGQQALGWITKKAVEFMNAEKESKEQKLVEAIQEKHIEKYLKEHGEDSLGFDIDELLKKLDKEND